MAAGEKFVTALGVVQRFGRDNPVLTKRDGVNGQTVYNFTILTGTQKKVGVTLWPELSSPGTLAKIDEGAQVAAYGKYTQSTGKEGQVYHNLSAYTIAVTAPEPKSERAVTNAQPAQVEAAAAPTDSPFDF